MTTLATTLPFKHAIRSASTPGRAPPIAPNASAIKANVVEALWSVAKATNRHRENASTAQNRNNPGAA